MIVHHAAHYHTGDEIVGVLILAWLAVCIWHLGIAVADIVRGRRS